MGLGDSDKVIPFLHQIFLDGRPEKMLKKGEQKKSSDDNNNNNNTKREDPKNFNVLEPLKKNYFREGDSFCLPKDKQSVKFIQPTVVAIDFNITVIDGIISKETKKWRDIADHVFNSISNHIDSCSVKTLYLALDDRDYVPKNKTNEQKERDKKAKQFTEEERSELIDNIYNKSDDLLMPESFTNWKSEDLILSLKADRTVRYEIAYWVMAIIWQKFIKKTKKREITLVYEAFKLGTFLKIKGFNWNHDDNEYFKKNMNMKVRMKIIFNKENPNGLPQIFDEGKKRQGEGECMIMRFINSLPLVDKDKILVVTTDTDFIAISLLNMSESIEKITDKFFREIYMYSYSYIVNINLLYRYIYNMFRDNMDIFGAFCPIETIVLMFIINGTDYTEGLPRIGLKTIFKYFFNEEGYKHWTRIKPVAQIDLSRVHNYKEAAMESERTVYGHAISTTQIFNDPFRETLIKVDRSSFLNFLKGLKSSGFNTDNMLSYYDRCVWVLNYWRNCGKTIKEEAWQFWDPLTNGWFKTYEIDESTGNPKFIYDFKNPMVVKEPKKNEPKKTKQKTTADKTKKRKVEKE